MVQGSTEQGMPRKPSRTYRAKPPDEISRNMAAIRSCENKTEASLRLAIHALGLRYRKYAVLPGRPDLTFPGAKLVVFVDGDYWHARDWTNSSGNALRTRISRLSEPSRNYWTVKFETRIARDASVTRKLRRQGWAVIRLWESDVRHDVEGAARTVVARVRQRRRELRRKSLA